MKVLAINGSPRKNWNTATLLQHALEGATAEGAETELIHLYDFNFKGCVSCFSCRRKGSPNYGRCAIKDELTPVLQRAAAADAIILGSPIYIGTATSQMRAFMERFMYPYVVYDLDQRTLFPKEIATAFIYTMGATETQLKEMGYLQYFKLTEMMMTGLFGSYETLLVTDTYQFDDYSEYVTTSIDPAAKAKRRTEVFPDDCRKAFELGARLARY